MRKGIFTGHSTGRYQPVAPWDQRPQINNTLSTVGA